MGCTHYLNPHLSGRVQLIPTQINTLNGMCVVIFVFELTVKLLGLGPRQYFSSYWNRLDFFIVVMALVDMIAEAIIIRDLESDGSSGFDIGPSISLLRLLRYEPCGQTDQFSFALTHTRNHRRPATRTPYFSSSPTHHASLTRLLRILRLSRMITQLKGVVRLMETLMQTVPKLANIALLLVLVIYIFAILGMNLYGNSVDTEVRCSLRNNSHARRSPLFAPIPIPTFKILPIMRAAPTRRPLTSTASTTSTPISNTSARLCSHFSACRRARAGTR